MTRNTPFVDPETTDLDIDQIYAEALPLAKLIALFVGIALVPLLLALAFGTFAGIGGLFVLIAQFVLAVGAGITLMYVIVRARTLSPHTSDHDTTTSHGTHTPNDTESSVETTPDDEPTREPDDEPTREPADDTTAVQAQRAQALTDADTPTADPDDEDDADDESDAEADEPRDESDETDAEGDASDAEGDASEDEKDGSDDDSDAGEDARGEDDPDGTA